MGDEIRIGGYVVLEPLGRGGMGAVYRARRVSDGSLVALKVMHLGARDDAVRMARFRREAEAAESLSHPGLVKVFDHGADGERLYMAMELVTGTPLHVYIAERGALPITHAWSIAIELLEALSACHKVGMLHRDVKPANVIIEPTGRARLLDLGLVKPLDRTVLTEEGSVVGTPRYMPPEALTEGESDLRGDIYQTGLVFYECVTARPFHGGEGMREVVDHVVNTTDVEVPAELAKAPQGMRDFLSCALAREPAERFESCAVAIACLRRGMSSSANITLKDGLRASAALPPGSATPVQGFPAVSRRLTVPTAPPAAAPERIRRFALLASVAGLALLAGVLWLGRPGGTAVAFGFHHPVVPQDVKLEAGPADLRLAWRTERPVRGVVTLPAIGRTESEELPRTEHALVLDHLMPETRYEVQIGDLDGPQVGKTALTRSVAGVVRELVQLLERFAVDQQLADLRSDLLDPSPERNAHLAARWRTRLDGRFGTEEFRSLAADFASVRALVPEADVPVELRARLLTSLAALDDLEEMLRTRLKLEAGPRLADLQTAGLEVEDRLPVGLKPFWAVRFGAASPDWPLPAAPRTVEAGEPAAFNSELDVVFSVAAPARSPAARHRFDLPGPLAPSGRLERVYLGFRLTGGGSMEKLFVHAQSGRDRVMLARLSPAPGTAERFVRLDERAVADPAAHLVVDFSNHEAALGRGVQLHTLALYVERS